MTAPGRGCVKTPKRPREIHFRLREYSVEVSCLLTGCYRFLCQSIAPYDVFEGDFWCGSVAEFSHSLGRKQTVILLIFRRSERPLSGKADIEPAVVYTPAKHCGRCHYDYDEGK